MQEISASRRYEYKINRNISWASLKNRILKLFIQSNDSFEILMELQDLFIKNIEPVRPGINPDSIQKEKEVSIKHLRIIEDAFKP